MQIYVDMDGVLADFDTHHEQVFGVRSDKLLDNVDWNKVRNHPNFYAGIPPMPDMFDLWEYLAPYDPIVLTGIPASVEEAAANKQDWIAKHLGLHVEVRCCRSKEKCLHAKRGDILIDDWEKYRYLWEDRGGVWITHINAANTIRQLIDRGL